MRETERKRERRETGGEIEDEPTAWLAISKWIPLSSTFPWYTLLLFAILLFLSFPSFILLVLLLPSPPSHTAPPDPPLSLVLFSRANANQTGLESEGNWIGWSSRKIEEIETKKVKKKRKRKKKKQAAVSLAKTFFFFHIIFFFFFFQFSFFS